MGYGYSSGGGFATLLLIAFAACYVVAWFLAMGIVTKAANEKGYDDLGGKLWFIGLFGFVFTPAIIVAALPDKRAQGESGDTKVDELPDL